LRLEGETTSEDARQLPTAGNISDRLRVDTVDCNGDSVTFTIVEVTPYF
jgi:hypothetical protein